MARMVRPAEVIEGPEGHPCERFKVFFLDDGGIRVSPFPGRWAVTWVSSQTEGTNVRLHLSDVGEAQAQP